MPDPTIFLSAGEASGEHYGALLLEELRHHLPGARFTGMGGPRMESLGLHRIVRAEDVAVMGITEIIRHLPRIYAEYRKLRAAIRANKPGANKPDIAILIDFPDIHLKLAEQFHRQGTPVIFFVSPQLWAWKKHRIKQVQQHVDKMLVIFPFEEPFYRERGVDATYVGHPLADLPLPAITRDAFAESNGLDPAATWIGLLPGSRSKEIRLNLPEMLRAASLLLERHPQENFQFLLPLAPTLTEDQRTATRSLIAEHAPRLPLRLIRDARPALHHARASIVASGTATVEAALIGNPFIVVYRVSALTYAIAKRVVSVPHVAMANLIADKRIVPELLQQDFTAEKIVLHLEPLLPDGPVRQSMMKELSQVARNLHNPDHRTAIERVAEISLAQLAHYDSKHRPALHYSE